VCGLKDEESGGSYNGTKSSIVVSTTLLQRFTDSQNIQGKFHLGASLVNVCYMRREESVFPGATTNRII
jgi:hypothetical protein